MPQHIESEREKRINERIKRVSDLIPRTPRVRVVPMSDAIRKGIVHPVGNLKFPEGHGSVEWPLDSFTQRRLRDGTVRLEDPHVRTEPVMPATPMSELHHQKVGAPGVTAPPHRTVRPPPVSTVRPRTTTTTEHTS